MLKSLVKMIGTRSSLLTIFLAVIAIAPAAPHVNA
jgi:hypothetical protein